MQYTNAVFFFVKGVEPPIEWKGNLNISYKVGPGFITNNTLVRMEIHNKYFEEYIYNVIGTIYGQEEPDRYVLMGNHRDSWVFGAVDAVSGTAVTNEVARGLGLLLKVSVCVVRKRNFVYKIYATGVIFSFIFHYSSLRTFHSSATCLWNETEPSLNSTLSHQRFLRPPRKMILENFITEYFNINYAYELMYLLMITLAFLLYFSLGGGYDVNY